MAAAKPPYETIVRRYGEAAIAEAATFIRLGQPVAVPTETVYGLAADATDGAAVARIYAAKGRPSFNPLIVHVADLEAAEAFGVFDDTARMLARAFWPGPLTLVVPLRPGGGIASLVTAGLPTIALRVPAHRAMQALLASTDRPLAAPSANRSGRISPTRADHVLRTLDGEIAMIINDGPTAHGLESTIVRAADGVASILRDGPITAESLAQIVTLEPHVAGDNVTAPGQLASHYAPQKPLRLNALDRKDGEWLIGFGLVEGDTTLSSKGDLVEAAAKLFDALHEADSSRASRISTAPIPGEGLAVAIRDRLTRAAHR